MKTNKSNLVWIELPKPADEAHAKELCELANNMLAKLGIHERYFDWSEKRCQFTFGNDQDYEELANRGKWLNLNFLGRKE